MIDQPFRNVQAIPSVVDPAKDPIHGSVETFSNKNVSVIGCQFFAPRWLVCFCLLSLGGLTLGVSWTSAEDVVRLRNEMILKGIYSVKASFDSGGGTGAVTTLGVIDDGLKRTYVHRIGMIVPDGVTQIRDSVLPIEIWQPIHGSGAYVEALGQVFGIGPFDSHGRRSIEVRGPGGGSLTIRQGIVEINKDYAILRALKGGSYNWDMRIATSTLTAEFLHRLFGSVLDQNDVSERFKAVRFFINAERFGAAKEELLRILKDFPEERGAEIEKQLIAYTELEAMQYLDEAKLREAAGQYAFARRILQELPVNRLSRESRLRVADAIELADQQKVKTSDAFRRLAAHIAELSPDRASALSGILAEIEAGLSIDTLPRLSDYLRLGDLETIALENRIALAVSGWLMGGGADEQNLEVAISLIKVRDLVLKYLAETSAPKRQEILAQLRGLEGSDPDSISKMLPLMVPALSFDDEAADEIVEGLYRIGRARSESLPLEQADVARSSGADEPSYVIQLPPEYDPLRQYPCILALHPIGGSAEDQIEWWAGEYVDSGSASDAIKQRRGQGSRHGYIVIAPIWKRPRQRQYEYTPVEHHRVLSSLRHAMRRASIDADRIFIVGHGGGATAAWDIALSHPDLWAGLISISGEPDKAIRHYHRNASYLSKYFVMGDIALGNVPGESGPYQRLGPLFDRYMTPRSDTMVVMYRGRGREFFYEESPTLFEWMELPSHRRPPIPKEIDVSTMRPGDNFFWWLELHDIKETVIVDPFFWEGGLAGTVDVKILETNTIRLNRFPSRGCTVWLTPEMGINMAERILVRGRKSYDFEGGVEVMLEDVRMRADRKRPFWAKIDIP